MESPEGTPQLCGEQQQPLGQPQTGKSQRSSQRRSSGSSRAGGAKAAQRSTKSSGRRNSPAKEDPPITVPFTSRMEQLALESEVQDLRQKGVLIRVPTEERGLKPCCVKQKRSDDWTLCGKTNGVVQKYNSSRKKTSPHMANGNAKTENPKSADHEESYPVRKHHQGFCVIIDCVGNDAEMLDAAFRSQYFTVECHMYKKVDEVEAILQDVAHMEQHRQHDVFVCIIISRGNADSLFCLDGDLPGLSLDRIKSFFTGQSCPNLRGKPKLFFIQNYLVSDTEEEGCVEVDGPQECAARRPQIQNHSRIPNEADIFWSHCRVKELELQRSSGFPSVYLRSLRDLLAEKKSSKDILDIHTELNRIIYAKKSGYFLQLRHTLTKKTAAVRFQRCCARMTFVTSRSCDRDVIAGPARIAT
ncbi:unnamed protein product [Ranitomeya imitator]|uniref:Caspase family p20 domain-containing protein n=1 Tax=Ranitomeya imitator TaxID=111125 RepID=A0ABN9KYE4_9NEOB|nr:unnamed protein product [Ranitomeya imitator]